MFYLYCIRLNRPEEEFWKSTLKKVMKVIDMNTDEEQMKAAAINNEPYTSKYFSEEPKVIHSMKEIEGFV